MVSINQSFYHIINQRVILILLFVFCQCSFLASQSNINIQRKIDSLTTVYHSEINDTNKISIQTRIAQLHRFIDIDTSKQLLWKVIAKHKTTNLFPRSHAFAYNVIADIYRLEPNVDSAKYYYQEAYDFFYEKHAKSFLAIAPPYGHFLMKNNEREKGIAIFDEAIIIAKKQNSYNDLGYLYESLGNVFFKIQKDNKKAKEFFQRSIAVCVDNNDVTNVHRLYAANYLNLSNIFLDEAKVDSAIVYAEKAVEFGEKARLYQKVVQGYNNLCQSYIELKEYKKASIFNEKALKLNPRVKNIYAIIESDIHHQTLRLYFDDFEGCILEGRNTLFQFSKNLDSKMKAEIYDNLCECYLLSGDSKKSLEAKDSLLYYTHHVLDIHHDDILAEMYDEFQLKEQKAKNELLLAKQEVVEKRLYTQRLAALGLIIALIFAIAWAVAVVRSNLQRKRYNEELETIVDERTKELQTANGDLERSNSQLRTLTYIASHDIKEPIRNIGNYAGFIWRKLSDKDKNELETYFQIIKKNTKQLYTLIEDFNSFLDLSSNNRLIKELIDLNEIVDNVETNLRSQNEYPHFKISKTVLPSITSNQSGIYMILKNLIENGLRHNESDIPTVEVSYRNTPECLEIIVSDNGIGIAPEYHKRIFEMFKRLHDRKQNEGSGIGLSIVKLLTNKLNGEIFVKSQLQHGSQFILSLPKDVIVEGAKKLTLIHS